MYEHFIQEKQTCAQFGDFQIMMMGMCCVGLMGSNKSFGLGLSDLDMAWLGMWCEGINC